MSYVASIAIVDPDCDQLPAVLHHAVIYVVNKSDLRQRLLTGKEH
jgi:hypothetical protein